jgi:predicted RNA-binding protein with PIN domain
MVDGMNVIGSRPDGWWRDRRGATLRLLKRLRALHERTARPITLVLDGRPTAEVPEGSGAGVTVVYARRRGRDAADDRLVELLAARGEPHRVEVVTSDRALAARAEALGATVTRPSALLRALDDARA